MACQVLAFPAQSPLCFSPQPVAKRTKRPLTSLSASTQKPLSSYKLKEGQSRHFHRLPSGLAMEVISQIGHASAAELIPNPPLVFVHGSFHAAWCWAEYWLPFFSRSGFDCYALSLLGQGESDVPTGAVAGTLKTHRSDIADFIRKEVSLPPVLIGHSFGGLVVQSYISNMRNQYSADDQLPSSDNFHPMLAGAVLVCSVPPSGNSGLVWRYLLSKPVAAIKVTLSLAAKAFANSLPLCKETFFSSEIEDHIALRRKQQHLAVAQTKFSITFFPGGWYWYQGLMKESSRVPLFDLKKLNASLPMPSIPRNAIELLVMGASNDFIVDTVGLCETAKFYDVQPVCVEGLAHDMMLDCSWEKGAEIILSWLKSLHKAQTA